MNAKGLFFYNLLLSRFPSALMMRVKIFYLRLCGVNFGENVSIEPDVVVRGNGHLSIGSNSIIRSGVVIEVKGGECIIGSNCELNHGTLIAANSGSQIVIEDDVHIAHCCSIKGSTHEINTEALRIGKGSIAGKSVFKNIHIGTGSWLGAGCIVLPGITIGRYNVIAAGAVVIKDSPSGVLIAGVPAVIKKNYTIK